MAKNDGLVLKLIGQSLETKSFQPDEREFLNGLTYREFYDLAAGTNSHRDYRNAPNEFREVITGLKESRFQLDSPPVDTEPVFIGQRKCVDFVVHALLAEVSPSMEKLASKYGSFTLPYGIDARGTQEYSPIQIGTGKSLPRLDGTSEIDLEAIFKSIPPIMDFGKYGSPRVFYLSIVSHDIGQKSLRFGKKESLKVERTRGNIGTHKETGIMNMFQIRYKGSAQVQYVFLPRNDSELFDNLRKFGVKY